MLTTTRTHSEANIVVEGVPKLDGHDLIVSCFGFLISCADSRTVFDATESLPRGRVGHLQELGPSRRVVALPRRRRRCSLGRHDDMEHAVWRHVAAFQMQGQLPLSDLSRQQTLIDRLGAVRGLLPRDERCR